jgi:hypothetical protein
MTQIRKISIITSLLWTTAIVASAIVKAPEFVTMMLLPILAFASLTTIQTLSRKSDIRPA